MPLTSDASGTDYVGSAGPATRLLLLHDDCHLFLGGNDGSIMVYEVRDKDGRLPQSDFGVKG
jgi:hypothetical protein